MEFRVLTNKICRCHPALSLFIWWQTKFRETGILFVCACKEKRAFLNHIIDCPQTAKRCRLWAHHILLLLTVLLHSDHRICLLNLSRGNSPDIACLISFPFSTFMLPVEWIIQPRFPPGKKEPTWINFCYYFHFMEHSNVIFFPRAWSTYSRTYK